jgi:predicted nucleic acid-binding protein
MTFDDITDGQSVFLDANTLIFHFASHPKLGAACTRLVERIERQAVQGYTPSHVLSDVTHRLMTLEAMDRFGWPATSLAARLRKQHNEIPNLTAHEAAIGRVPQMHIKVLPVTFDLVAAAASVSRQHELLTGDATIVAIMQHWSLTSLASYDSDFDRVPWLTRYSPA